MEIVIEKEVIEYLKLKQIDSLRVYKLTTKGSK